MLVFARNRGSIKEIEKELGISYPTVRGKIDDMVEAVKAMEIKQKQKLKKTQSKKASLKDAEDLMKKQYEKHFLSVGYSSHINSPVHIC